MGPLWRTWCQRLSEGSREPRPLRGAGPLLPAAPGLGTLRAGCFSTTSTAGWHWHGVAASRCSRRCFAPGLVATSHSLRLSAVPRGRGGACSGCRGLSQVLQPRAPAPVLGQVHWHPGGALGVGQGRGGPT